MNQNKDFRWSKRDNPLQAVRIKKKKKKKKKKFLFTIATKQISASNWNPPHYSKIFADSSIIQG